MEGASWSQGRVIPPLALNNPYHVDRVVLDTVKSLNPAVVADIGCADGRFAAALAPCEVVGVELDQSLAEAARDRCTRLVHGSIEDADTLAELAASGPFDVILAADVVEHLVQPELALRVLGQMLSDNGRLVISVPHLLYYRERLRLVSGRFETSPRGGLYDRTHLSFFSVAELSGLIERSDLVSDSLIGAGRVRPGGRIGRWPQPAPTIKGLADRYIAATASSLPSLMATSLIVTAKPRALGGVIDEPKSPETH